MNESCVGSSLPAQRVVATGCSGVSELWSFFIPYSTDPASFDTGAIPTADAAAGTFEFLSMLSNESSDIPYHPSHVKRGTDRYGIYAGEGGDLLHLGNFNGVSCGFQFFSNSLGDLNCRTFFTG